MKERINIPGKGMLLVGGSGSMMAKSALSTSELPKGTKPIEEDSSSFDYAPAGDADEMFEEMLKDAMASTIITPGITFKSEMLFGGGIAWGKHVKDENGNYVYSEVRDGPAIEFNKKSNIPLHMMAVNKDFTGLGTGYFQVSLNDAGDKIVMLTSHQSRCRNTRLGWRDTNGVIKHGYINAEFGRFNFDKTKTKKLRLIQTIYDPADWLRDYVKRGGKDRHFLYPIQFVSLSSENYYPLPDWNSARVSGWLKVAKNITKLKEHLMEGVMNLKYHLEVDPEYWPMRFGEEQWDSWSDETKLTEMEGEKNRLEKFFANLEGGNVFMSQMLEQAVGQDARSSIKVHEFKQQFPEGIHVEDMTEAVSHLLFSLGLHPSIFGSGGSKGLGNSGSEGRVSYDQRKQNIVFYQEQLVKPLEMVAAFNGWDKDLVPRIRMNPDMPTLNQVPPAEREISNPENG